MEAIILAGGKGTRLKAVVNNVPKPMAPIQGRPFLEVLLANLASNGVRRAILSVGYMADVIVQHFGDEFGGIELTYANEEEPLGTGGAIAMALRKCRGDHAFVLNGDTFLDFDLRQVERVWQRNRRPVIVLRSVLDTSRYGRVGVEGGKVVQFQEKGLSGEGLVNAGCYLVPTNLFDNGELPATFSFESDFLVDAIRDGDFAAFIGDGLFIDIGIPEDFTRAQSLLKPYLK